jgi:hypothetical protein
VDGSKLVVEGKRHQLDDHVGAASVLARSSGDGRV